MPLGSRARPAGRARRWRRDQNHDGRSWASCGPRGPSNEPGDPQRTIQDEKPVPVKVSGPRGADVANKIAASDADTGVTPPEYQKRDSEEECLQSCWGKPNTSDDGALGPSAPERTQRHTICQTIRSSSRSCSLSVRLWRGDFCSFRDFAVDPFPSLMYGPFSGKWMSGGNLVRTPQIEDCAASLVALRCVTTRAGVPCQ